MTELLTIRQLTASVGDTRILKGVDLTIKPGEVHVVMGPNGSGKSTLSSVLAGKPGYEISGACQFDQQDLLALSPDERAHLGLFLAFQYPVEIPGVNNLFFLKTAYNALRKAQGAPPLDAVDFIAEVKRIMVQLKMDQQFLKRCVNEGFSGGEKKKNAILQMLLLSPKLAILDEADSGLDIDALQVIADGVQSFRSPERSLLLVTHYQRLLNYITPDVVHVMIDGRIIVSGDAGLALQLESDGYAPFLAMAKEQA